VLQTITTVTTLYNQKREVMAQILRLNFSHFVKLITYYKIIYLWKGIH